MNRTLLALVQRTLGAMDSESVGSIGDTIESMQLVDEVEFIFYEFISRHDWLFTRKVQQLGAVSDTSRPNYMLFPDDIWWVDHIRYETTEQGDTNREFKTIDYKDPESFLELVQSRKSSESNISTVTSFEGVDMFIINDEFPDYWTTFDDTYVVFDKWNQDEDSTMRNSKSQALVMEVPTFKKEDTFVIPIPEKAFPAFESEVRVVAFQYFREQENPVDTRRAFRGISRLRRNAPRTEANSTVNPRKVRLGR